MPEPVLTTIALLEAAGPALIKGVATVLGKEAAAKWLQSTRVKTAVRQARAATAARYKSVPGAEDALQAWAESPSFENLVLDACRGNQEALTPGRVADSFIESGGAVGWGRKKQERAEALTRVFLELLFDELSKGPEGQALARRLAEAREQQAQRERERTHQLVQEARDYARLGYEATEAGQAEILSEIKDLKTRPLPDPIKEALRAPVFNEITRLLQEERTSEALALADQALSAVEQALYDTDDMSGRHAEEVRPFRQRLLFAAATAAGWELDPGTARERVVKAFELGPVQAKLIRPAVRAAFNASYEEGLRRLVETMPAGHPEKLRAQVLLSFTQADWETASRLARDLNDPDLAGLLADAEVALLDASDPQAVQATADLLTRAEEAVTIQAGSLALARTSLKLLSKVLRAPTPLSFDRAPLVDATFHRVRDTFYAAPHGSVARAHALALAGDAAKVLRDPPLRELADAELERLPADVRDRVFVLYDPAPSLEDLSRDRQSGLIAPVEAALVTADTLQKRGDLTEAAQTLREAMEREESELTRVPLLSALLSILRQDGKRAEADALLAAAAIPEPDRWLLGQRAGQPRDLEEARAFPLDARVLQHVAEQLTQTTPSLGQAHWNPKAVPPEPGSVPRGDEPSEPPPLDPERPSYWTAQLIRVLPSRSSFLAHAEALFHDGQYERLLSAVECLDEVFAPQAADLKASALRGLGRPLEAAQSLLAEAERLPQHEGIAVNASAILLEQGRPDLAVRLLAPRVDEQTQNTFLLVNYAVALTDASPADPDAASQALDLLIRAREVDAILDLEPRMWATACAAGRGPEAAGHLERLAASSAQLEIRSREDAQRVLDGEFSSGGFLTGFTGDIGAFLDALRERAERAQKGIEAISRMNSAHAIAYADLLRDTAQAWKHWIRWTTGARAQEARLAHPVLADWPSSVFAHRRQFGPPPKGIYADTTALLTLGVLGLEKAARLLGAAAPVYLERGVLQAFQKGVGGLAQEIMMEGSVYEERIVERYSDTNTVLSPGLDSPLLQGPQRTLTEQEDLDAARRLGGRYVSDLDRPREEDARGTVVSSAALLVTLNLEGVVDRESARRAAQYRPSVFAEWEQAEPLKERPAVLVFDRHAIVDWEEVGLLAAIQGAVRIGPWAWAQLHAEIARKRTTTAAHQRLLATVSVLHDALLASHAFVVEPVAPAGEGPELTEEYRGTVELFEGTWASALRTVRTAQAHDLQLWADDRFYTLLLWLGGPTVTGPALDALRAPLLALAEQTLPTPTADLVARLAREGKLDDAEARSLCGSLFDNGYRPAHPLALADALERFVLPESGPLRGRFSKLVEALRALPEHMPDEIEAPRRQGFIRSAAAELGPELVLAVHRHPGLTREQRQLLSDALLGALEDVFLEQSPGSPAPRSDRTRLLFWSALAGTLVYSPFQSSATTEDDEGLSWLGRAAAERADPHDDITRFLEDIALDTLGKRPVPDSITAALENRPDLSGDTADLQASSDAVATVLAYRALIPLLDSDLLGRLDPLLRRTVLRLARHAHESELNRTLTATVGGKSLSIVVSEEEEDQVTLELIRRIRRGDTPLGDQFQPTRFQFSYGRKPPPEWVEAGVPEGTALPFEVERSFFTLLWLDEPGFDAPVLAQLQHALSLIDPPLALHLLDHSDELLNENDAVRNRAKDELALELLQSGFFELQRDLGHAIWRMRKWETSRLLQFLGHIGEEEGRRLVAAEHAPEAGFGLAQVGVVPETFVSAARLLTRGHDDSVQVRELLQSAFSGPAGESSLDPTVWAASRAEATEVTSDPFVSARALHGVLLALQIDGFDPDLDERGATSEWARTYLEAALSETPPDGAAVATPLDVQHRLGRASLLLAAFVCQGDHHVETFQEDEDPLAIWLDRVLLLASRLIIALPVLYGEPSEAVVEAERAIEEFGIDPLAFRVTDVFDPFALASSDHLGRVLTLVAVLRSIGPGQPLPKWWSPHLESRLNELAVRPHSDPTPENVGDRFNIGTPLRERDLARAILERVIGSPPDGESEADTPPPPSS